MKKIKVQKNSLIRPVSTQLAGTTVATNDQPKIQAANPRANSTSPARAMTQLQRSVGNSRASVSLVQPKLEVNTPGDHHEQEANAVAQKVVHRKTEQQHCPECQTKLEQDPNATLCPNCQTKLQRQTRHTTTQPEVTPDIEHGIETSRGGGQPLPKQISTSMGQAMGADFSGVRVHTDAKADGLNRSLEARAFTTGQDVFFKQGEYAPESSRGQELLAHELTHVMQQTGGQSSGQVLSRMVQRTHLDLPAGGSVGDQPATNQREGVMLVLNRLHEFWAITNADFDRVYPTVTSLASGEAVTNKSTLAVLHRALNKLEEPILPAVVGNAQFELSLGGGVGVGQTNHRIDVASVQDLLHVRWHLTNEAYNREHTAVTSGVPLNKNTLRETFAGITKLKRAAVAGVGKAGWNRLIRSDESGPIGPSGQDRLADRTFNFGSFLIFVPTGALANSSNKVHVFFSAGGVQGDDSHVEHHGLRGAAERHDWILFGVPGRQGRHITISEDQVRQGLESIGRSAQITSVRMSAHSRGNAHMAQTLQEHLFSTNLVDHITVLDGSDFSKPLIAGFRASQVSLNRVTADFVTTGQFRQPGVHSQGINAAGIRALGYARLINDAVATHRINTLPHEIERKVSALPLPSRGSFSAASPVPAGKIDINAFMHEHQSVLNALRSGEAGVSNVAQLEKQVNSSPIVPDISLQ